MRSIHQVPIATITAILALAGAALAGAALAQNLSTLTTGIATIPPGTTIVAQLTTVCGTATVLTMNGNYYTCTEAMTLTITDCPCTMTHPTSISTAIAVAAASSFYPPLPTTISTTTVPGTCPAALPPSPTQNLAGAGTGTGCLLIGTPFPPTSTPPLHPYTNGAGAGARRFAGRFIALLGLGALCAALL